MREEVKKELGVYKKFLRDNGLESPDPYFLTNLRLVAGNADSHYEDYDRIKELWSNHATDGSLELYVHIPYCSQQCHYCCYTGEIPVGKDELNIYVDRLVKHFRFLSPTMKGRLFDNLHIGGGTPSILDEELVLKLLSELTSSFEIDPKGQRSFEFNPSSFSPKKMAILRDFGFNKVSMGVQSFDGKTLRMNNRSDQTTDLVNRSVKEALRLGFDWVNVDLLVGMYGDTEEKAVMSFDKATRLGPHSIYLYSIKPTDFYLEELYGMGRDEYFEEAQKAMDSMIEKVLPIAEERGYISVGVGALPRLGYQNTWIFLRKDLNPTKFYCFGNDQENSVLGIGKGSISYVRKGAKYEMTDPLTDDPSDYKFMVTPYDKRRGMLSLIFNDLSLTSGISRQKFKKVFDEDILSEFGAIMGKLEEIGAVTVTEKEVAFNSDLPGDRLLYALFFLGEDRMAELLKNNKIMKRDKSEYPVDERPAKSTVDSTADRFDEKVKNAMSDNKAGLIDGTVVKTFRGSLSVLSGGKKVKILIDDLTKTIESKDKGEGQQPSFVKEISKGDIRPDDKVSIFVKTDGDKMEAVLIRRIV